MAPSVGLEACHSSLERDALFDNKPLEGCITRADLDCGIQSHFVRTVPAGLNDADNERPVSYLRYSKYTRRRVERVVVAALQFISKTSQNCALDSSNFHDFLRFQP